MLGCQDFCGYYDWTFHYIRQRFGQDAVHKFWKQSIADDAQQHYTAAGRDKGLRGLYDTWVKTGEDEKCDWTFTLDELRNNLRMDMRECPSKGFLLQNDLNTDEDYCDHCIGWIGSALDSIGAQVVSHEHNHCGQCWWEMGMKDTPHLPLELEIDIRNDPRWARGYVDGWRSNAKLPLLDEAGSSDPCEVLIDWFAGHDGLTVLGRGPSATDQFTMAQPRHSVVVTDPTYVSQDVYKGDPVGVLIGDQPVSLERLAERFNATSPENRPLLMHMYLPGNPMIDFVGAGLPRPVPILPTLIRSGLYVHQPHQPYPTTGTFMLMLAVALDKEVIVSGIDLYGHPSGRTYAHEDSGSRGYLWPGWHSLSCELAHLRAAIDRSTKAVTIHPCLADMLAK